MWTAAPAEGSGEAGGRWTAPSLLPPFTPVLLLQNIGEISEDLLHREALWVGLSPLPSAPGPRLGPRSRTLLCSPQEAAGSLSFQAGRPSRASCGLLSGSQSSCQRPASPGTTVLLRRHGLTAAWRVHVQPQTCTTAPLWLQGLLLSTLQDAHEQGINAAGFSCAELLATGGTDRVVKLWDISSGRLLPPGLFMPFLRRHLTADVIRVAGAQSHAGRQRRGHHLRPLQPHGELDCFQPAGLT